MIRLVENFSTYKKDIQELPVTDTKLVEDKSGKKYETKKKYRVDVSRFTENLNNRVYSKSLWENVIKNQKNLWEGSFALADHPSDEGSFKDVMGVWSNLHINEDSQTVKADVTFVGTYGQKAIEILEAGGRIGFSSSGFGDLKEDGKTVEESTYQIERIADCVLNPSQQVFGTIQDAIEESTKSVKEDTKEHIKMSANKQSKLEERKFRETVTSYLSQIKEKTDSPDNKLVELNELLSYFDESSPKDLRESVEAEVAKTNSEIEEALKHTTSLKETFGTSNPEEFKEGFAKLATETSLYERQIDDWKKLAENLQKTISELKEEISERPTKEMLDESFSRVKFVREKYFNKEKELESLLEGKDKEIKENSEIHKRVLFDLKEAVKSLRESEAINSELLQNNKELLIESTELKKKLLEMKQDFSKKMKEATALPKVKYTDPKTMFSGYSESTKVLNYYNDLEKQHGKHILPYKEKILSCKTIFEAMRIYNTALSEMTDAIYTSTGGNLEENKKLVEEATGMKIAHNRELKKPAGWE